MVLVVGAWKTPFRRRHPALAGRLAQVLCPLADRLVAAHAAQGCGARWRGCLDRVALDPGIGDALEVGGQGPHLVCSDDASGTSMMVGLCQPGCAEARPGIGDKRFDECPRVWV